MLKPFQIKDLHTSSSPAPEEGVSTSTGPLREERQSYDIAGDALGQSRTQQGGQSQSYPHGVVRLSATEYDDLASNHPTARLTYIDDDDGELITVCHTKKPSIPSVLTSLLGRLLRRTL